MVWLALDLGTSGVKAALLEDSGEVLEHAYRSYPSHSPAAGWLEQDAGDWWEAAREAVLELSAHRAQAVALTGQMQDVILLDGEGDPVRPVILYSDSRAEREAAALNETVGFERLRRLTGNEQGASGLLAKLRWLAAHDPLSLNRAAHLLLGAADYLAFRLSGAAATDTTTASTTGLLELSRRTWLGAEDGLTPEAARLLPRLVGGGARVGSVGRAAAEALGLRPGLPVHLGPGDAGAATLGAGGGARRRPYAYLGTSGWVAFSAAQRAAEASGAFTLAHPDPARFICVAPLLTALGNLEWLLGVLERGDHAKAIAAALERPATRLLYLPYLLGERSPFSDPHARAAFIGLSPGHTGDDLVRAVLEGVAFAYRHALEALSAEPVESLVLTGGGARSSHLCQLIADVLGAVVVVPDDASYTGVKGAVLAARVARGEAVGYDARQPSGRRLEPRESSPPEKYALFKDAYPALRDLFARMASLPLGT